MVFCLDKLKGYITKDERWYIATLFIANEAVEKLLGYGMSKEERRNLKTCKTYFDKYSKELFKRVGEAESKKLINMFSGGKIEIKANVAYAKLHDVLLDAADVHDLAGPIIESHCRGCHKTGTDAAECSIHKIFVRALVPTIDDIIPVPDKLISQWKEHGKTYVKTNDTYEGRCPYYYQTQYKGDSIDE